MSPGNDSLPTAVESAKERDLRPLAEESTEALGLDERQRGEMEHYLHDAWFFGVRTGHAVMLEAKMGEEADPAPVIKGMQEEFQSLMEDLADRLDMTVSATMAAWNYLGRAWIAGARFWEVEIAARLIEAEAGSIEEAMDRLDD